MSLTSLIRTFGPSWIGTALTGGSATANPPAAPAEPLSKPVPIPAPAFTLDHGTFDAGDRDWVRHLLLYKACHDPVEAEKLARARARQYRNQAAILDQIAESFSHLPIPAASEDTSWR